MLNLTSVWFRLDQNSLNKRLIKRYAHVENDGQRFSLSFKQRSVASKINCVTGLNLIYWWTSPKVCDLNNPRKYLISQKTTKTNNLKMKGEITSLSTLQSQTSNLFWCNLQKKDISAKFITIQFDHENSKK